MEESEQVANLMGFGPGRNIISHFTTALNAPEEEFIFNKSDVGNPRIGIKHYDLTKAPLPSNDEKSTNLSFEASVLPKQNMIRIRHLKFDGQYEQPNSIRSGSDILSGIVKAGKSMGHDVYIDEDISYLALNNPRQTKVDLAKLKILESGISYYNKAGFYPENFDDVYQYNQTQRAKKLSKYYKGRHLDDLNDDLESNFTSDTTLSEVGDYIRTKVGRNIPMTDDFAAGLQDLLGKISFNVKDRNLKYVDK